MFQRFVLAETELFYFYFISVSIHFLFHCANRLMSCLRSGQMTNRSGGADKTSIYASQPKNAQYTRGISVQQVNISGKHTSLL